MVRVALQARMRRPREKTRVEEKSEEKKDLLGRVTD
jgi:hypothetical protein